MVPETSSRVWITIYKQAHTHASKCLRVGRPCLLILTGRLPFDEFHQREQVLYFGNKADQKIIQYKYSFNTANCRS